MKNLQTFEEFLNESILNEKRISFRGKTTNDLYRIVKNDPNSMVFANGKHYSILDPSEMRNDLKNDSTYVYDKDGEEYEIKVSDIEFIEINESKMNETFLDYFKGYDPNLTLEQNHVRTLLDYVIMEVDEDDYDTLEARIGRALKNGGWKFDHITEELMGKVKEILKKYYDKEKLITKEMLRNKSKKREGLVAAMNWLNA